MFHAKKEDVQIIPINKTDLSLLNSFTCGEKDTHIKLADFLKKRALEHNKNFISTTHCLFYKGASIGYYTICAASVQSNYALSKKAIKKARYQNLYYSEYPAVRLTQLATHFEYQFGKNAEVKKVGTFMLQFLIGKLIQLNKEYLGIRFLFATPEEPEWKWYERIGFKYYITEKGIKYYYFDLMDYNKSVENGKYTKTSN